MRETRGIYKKFISFHTCRAGGNRRSSTPRARTTMRIPRIVIVHSNVFSVALNHFYDPTMRAELEMPNPPVPSLPSLLSRRCIRAHIRPSLICTYVQCVGYMLYIYTYFIGFDSLPSRVIFLFGPRAYRARQRPIFIAE